MCTAVSLNKCSGVFGRTLDYDFGYGEEVVITKRFFPFDFGGNACKNHFAFIGTAKVVEGYPLYYDAINEKGVYIAGLNFVGNAHYFDGEENGKTDIAQYELIPYLMCKCSSVDGVIYELSKINITGRAFGKELPAAQLHWFVGDGEKSITVESVKERLKIYENPVGVLTNNPPFDMQLFNLNNFRNLTAGERESAFGVPVQEYGRGLGAMGLPGDWSPQSRFVRAAFANANSVCGDSEEERVNQLFRILNAVAVPAGCCKVGDGYERTIYTSVCSAKTTTYYFCTYGSYAVYVVSLKDIDGDGLIRFPHKVAAAQALN